MTGLPQWAGLPGFDQWGRSVGPLPPGMVGVPVVDGDPHRDEQPSAEPSREDLEVRKLLELKRLVHTHPMAALRFLVDAIASGHLRLRFSPD